MAVLGIEATPTPTPTPQLTEEEMAQAEAAASALSSGGQTANGGEAPMSEDDKVTMSGGDQGTSSTSGNGNVNNDDTDKEPLPDSIPIPGSLPERDYPPGKYNGAWKPYPATTTTAGDKAVRLRTLG